MKHRAGAHWAMVIAALVVAACGDNGNTVGSIGTAGTAGSSNPGSGGSPAHAGTGGASAVGGSGAVAAGGTGGTAGLSTGGSTSSGGTSSGGTGGVPVGTGGISSGGAGGNGVHPPPCKATEVNVLLVSPALGTKTPLCAPYPCGTITPACDTCAQQVCTQWGAVCISFPLDSGVLTCAQHG